MAANHRASHVPLQSHVERDRRLNVLADGLRLVESVTRIGQEVTNFVEMGMTPLQAVQAATSVAAELLRLDARVGTVTEGFEADLIAVEANPLVDIRALQDPLLVISNGRLALNRLQFGR